LTIVRRTGILEAHHQKVPHKKGRGKKSKLKSFDLIAIASMRQLNIEVVEFRKALLMEFSRITVDQDKMGGIPCIRGLRIPVATVVGMVASGMTTEDILHEYPDLEADDIREALRYAAEAVRERQLPLLKTA